MKKNTKAAILIMCAVMILNALFFSSYAEEKERRWVLVDSVTTDSGIKLDMYADNCGYVFEDEGAACKVEVSVPGVPDVVVSPAYGWQLWYNDNSGVKTDTIRRRELEETSDTCTFFYQPGSFHTYDGQDNWNLLKCTVKVSEEEFELSGNKFYIGPVKNYTDIGEYWDSNWYNFAVRKVSTRLWHFGYIPDELSGCEFEPDAKVSRGLFCAMRYGFGDNQYNPYEGGFKDVTETLPYRKSIGFFAKLIWKVVGDGNGNFMPDKPVTRQEAVTMIYREYEWNRQNKEEYKESETTDNLNSFADRASVAQWAEKPLAWAVKVGFISGSQNADGLYLNPEASLTRAEACCILQHLFRR